MRRTRRFTQGERCENEETTTGAPAPVPWPADEFELNVGFGAWPADLRAALARKTEAALYVLNDVHWPHLKLSSAIALVAGQQESGFAVWMDAQFARPASSEFELENRFTRQI